MKNAFVWAMVDSLAGGCRAVVEFACFVARGLQEAGFAYFDEGGESVGLCGGSQSYMSAIYPWSVIVGSSI